MASEAVRLARVLSGHVVAAERVLAVGHDLKVIRSDARLHPAQMINGQAFGDHYPGQLPCQSQQPSVFSTLNQNRSSVVVRFATSTLPGRPGPGRCERRRATFLRGR
jgi:hypothetical protein